VTAANGAAAMLDQAVGLTHAIGLEWLAATAGLPVAAPVSGGVQARGPGGVELSCLVCGALFIALACRPTPL
jgi:hypothetical protein